VTGCHDRGRVPFAVVERHVEVLDGVVSVAVVFQEE
jgi:hypothetical protein